MKLTRLNKGIYFFSYCDKNNNSIKVEFEKINNEWYITHGIFGENNYWTEIFPTLKQCKDEVQKYLNELNEAV